MTVLYVRLATPFMPVETMAENGIGMLLLRIRHARIQCIEGREEFLDALGVGLGNVTIGAQIVHCCHSLGLVGPSLHEGVDPLCIVPHHCSDVLPEVFLLWSNLELGMQFLGYGISCDPPRLRTAERRVREAGWCPQRTLALER